MPGLHFNLNIKHNPCPQAENWGGKKQQHSDV